VSSMKHQRDDSQCTLQSAMTALQERMLQYNSFFPVAASRNAVGGVEIEEDRAMAVPRQPRIQLFGGRIVFAAVTDEDTAHLTVLRLAVGTCSRRISIRKTTSKKKRTQR